MMDALRVNLSPLSTGVRNEEGGTMVGAFSSANQQFVVANEKYVDVISHRFMFKTQKHTVKPTFLEVKRLREPNSNF